MSVKENIDYVKNSIVDICKKSNRDPKDIVLLPVSKTKPVSMMKEVVEAGVYTFGENKVQEILKKYEYFKDDMNKINFHMIGHLQTNKVKYIIDKVKLIHSLESISLLDKLQKEAEKRNLIVNCLIEVNIAKETSKFGVFEEDIFYFLQEVEKRKNVKVLGLMTVAPYFEDSFETRSYFKKMKILFDKISKESFDNIEMKILSMGMSNDFKIAIEEGANLVRVGSLIFGKRDYGKI